MSDLTVVGTEYELHAPYGLVEVTAVSKKWIHVKPAGRAEFIEVPSELPAGYNYTPEAAAALEAGDVPWKQPPPRIRRKHWRNKLVA